MEAIRKILPNAQDSITIDLPASFRDRTIEVVVMQLDAGSADTGGHDASAWPADFFKQVAGAWSGEPLVRAPQGAAEPRSPLD